MKRLLYSIIGLGAAVIMTSTQVMAQSFETEVADTLKLAVYKDIDAYSRITNKTPGNIKIEWKVKSHNFPPSWSSEQMLGICDNSLCRQNKNNQLLSGTTFTSMDYIPNVPGDFHVQMVGYDNSNVIPGTYYITVNLKENGGSYEKDVTFVFTKYPTDVNSVNRANDNIVMYPNPARGELNVLFGNTGAKNITIYNLVGKQVSAYRVTGNSAKLDIERIPSGVYLLRLTDANNQTIATKRFTHQ